MLNKDLFFQKLSSKSPEIADIGFLLNEEQAGNHQGTYFCWFGSNQEMAAKIREIPEAFQEIEIPYISPRDRNQIKDALWNITQEIAAEIGLDEHNLLLTNNLLLPFELEILWWGKAVDLARSKEWPALNLRMEYWRNSEEYFEAGNPDDFDFSKEIPEADLDYFFEFIGYED